MSFFRMGNRFKNRKFDYIPRYYDPVKEEFEQRLKGYNQKADAAEIAKSRIRLNFKRGSVESVRYASRARKRSNYRLLIIIAFLILITFITLTKFLPSVIQMVEN